MAGASRTIPTPDGPMRVYEATPEHAAPPRSAVIVVMEAFGLNDHIEDVTRRVAAAGYHAVAPDLFHRAGGPPADYGDFGRVIELFAGVTDESVERDLAATLAALAEEGYEADHVGITGFCWGGWVTFLAALRFPLGAAVTWYGGGIVKPGVLPFPPLVEEVPSLQAPWLGLFGELDDGIPQADLDALQSALDAGTAVAHEIVRYPGAKHGFHCDARPDAYDAASAAAGWERATAWLATHLRHG